MKRRRERRATTCTAATSPKLTFEIADSTGVVVPTPAHATRYAGALGRIVEGRPFIPDAEMTLMAVRLVEIEAVDVAGAPVAGQDPTAERVLEIVQRLLSEHSLCSLATVGPGGRAHINSAHFAFSDELDLYFLSHPEAWHCRNLAANPSAAIAVFSSDQPWGGKDEGLQLLGTCSELDSAGAEVAENLYLERFAAYGGWKSTVDSADPTLAFRFYRFHTHELKLLAERDYGSAILVRATVERG